MLSPGNPFFVGKRSLGRLLETPVTTLPDVNALDFEIATEERLLFDLVTSIENARRDEITSIPDLPLREGVPYGDEVVAGGSEYLGASTVLYPLVEAGDRTVSEAATGVVGQSLATTVAVSVSRRVELIFLVTVAVERYIVDVFVRPEDVGS